MALSGFKAENHPQQIAKRGAADEIDDRATHPLDFSELAERHGPFTLDVAAAAHNTKCEQYLTRDQDGLIHDWGGASCLVQPAVLRHRTLGGQGLGGVCDHRRHCHAPPCQPDRAELVALHG